MESLGFERRKPAVVPTETDTKLLACKDELFRAISDRAYSLFQQRGAQHGADVSDWITAEEDLLRPMPCELAQKGNELMLRVEVPGFNERELRIGIAKNQVWISGHKERLCGETSQDVIFNEIQSKDAFRIIELPRPIDPEKASVILHRGLLTIFMRKASAADLQADGQAA